MLPAPVLMTDAPVTSLFPFSDVELESVSSAAFQPVTTLESLVKLPIHPGFTVVGPGPVPKVTAHILSAVSACAILAAEVLGCFPCTGSGRSPNTGPGPSPPL